MKKVFICSAFRGDMEQNIRKTNEYCRWTATECGANPIAPHLIYPQFLDDGNETEHELGIECGLELLSFCDELWYFCDPITEGMIKEISRANELGIPIRCITNAELATDQMNENGGMLYVKGLSQKEVGNGAYPVPAYSFAVQCDSLCCG